LVGVQHNFDTRWDPKNVRPPAQTGQRSPVV